MQLQYSETNIYSGKVKGIRFEVFVNSLCTGNMLAESLDVRVAYQSECTKKSYLINNQHERKLLITLLQITRNQEIF